MDKYLESLVKKGEIKTNQVEEVQEEEVVREIEEVLNPEPESAVEEVSQSEPEVKEPEVDKKVSATPKPETTSVINIRIFNVPDIRSPFKMYTGNVIVTGKVSDMTSLDYVKPGFGIVTGFTPDLK